MKKIILILTAILAFGFEMNKEYECKTIGVSFKKDGKVYNIPYNEKTQKELKKDLGSLIKIGFKKKKNSIEIEFEGERDILKSITSLKNKIDVYSTNDLSVLVFVDRNVSQIALKNPSQQTVIYYDCKKVSN